MARTTDGLKRGAARDLAVHAVARHLLGLMTLRAATIGAKFALTLFIARYLGLAPLGIYGIIASATVLSPVLLGFGVSNNLGREAMRIGPDAIIARLLQYFIFLIPAYAVIGGSLSLLSSEAALWITLLSALLFLEHVQTDLFVIMSVTGHPHGANLVFFIRSSAWALIYMPLAIADPDIRNLKAIGLFWLAGNVLATVVAVALTLKWRWWNAVKTLATSKMTLPHRHGSTTLYVNDVANTSFAYIDRYIIGIFLSHEMLGVYTLFWSITNAMSNLIGLTMVQTRKGELLKIAYSSSLNSFNRALKTLTIKCVSMTFGLSILAIAAVHVAVPYVGRQELMNATSVLYILCGALAFRGIYEVLGISFYSYNRDDITLYSGLATLAISATLNFVLVPITGIWGAAIVSLVSYAVGVGARGLIISNGFRLGVPGTALTRVDG